MRRPAVTQIAKLKIRVGPEDIIQPPGQMSVPELPSVKLYDANDRPLIRTIEFGSTRKDLY